MDGLDFLTTMRGPEFLLLYLVWFLLLRGALLVARINRLDSPFITVAGLLLFEGVGLARILIGQEHGMHKWEFLILMMFIGGCLFLLRAENFQGGNSSGGCSSGSSGFSCSGGSSCSGGGGCGSGGGCGGCGGS